MSIKEKVRRYIVLFIGLMSNAFGVAMLTKSGLGASPIAAIPYALSLAFSMLTMGNWLIVFNFVLIILQISMLGKGMGLRNLILQAVLTFIYGYFTDFAVWALGWVSPPNYVLKLAALVIGCLFFGFGVNFELTSNMSMLPGNALPKVIASKLGKEYGPVRVICDVSMTVISAAISLIFLRKLLSVREGTVIAAFLIGNMVKLVKKLLLPLWTKLAESMAG